MTSPLLAGAGHIYWTDANGRAVMSTAADGKRSQTLAAGQYNPTGGAVHAGWVYFATRADGELKRARVPGGAVNRVLTDLQPPTHVAFTGVEVTWADETGTIFAHAP